MTFRRRLLLATLLLILGAVAVATIPPNCSYAFFTPIDSTTDYSPTGVYTGNIHSEWENWNQCANLHGVTYYRQAVTTWADGNWVLDPDQIQLDYCRPQVDLWQHQAQTGTGVNALHNVGIGYYTAGGGGRCNPSGQINDVMKTCPAQPCCGLGGVGCGSPLVGDPDGAGFLGNLTSVENGVRFDFNNTGKPIQIAWLRKGSGLLFLVYDWDHDGGVPRDGHDLIGTTSCPDAANGFVALGKLDSNHDGWFTPADREWANVRLWDGYSDRTVSLAEKGYTAIDLDYRKEPTTDQFGNGLSLWATAKGHLRGHSVVDVYFVEGK